METHERVTKRDDDGVGGGGPRFRVRGWSRTLDGQTPTSRGFVVMPPCERMCERDGRVVTTTVGS